MNALETVNVQKCLEVLTDFHTAVADEDLDNETRQSKELARVALEQLNRIIKQDGGNDKKRCKPGVQKINPNN